MNFQKILSKIFLFSPSNDNPEEIMEENLVDIKYDERKVTQAKRETVSAQINDNLNLIRDRFSVPKNNDVVIKQFSIKGDIKCFLFYYDGMSDTASINEYIIKGLLELPYVSQSEPTLLADAIKNQFIIHAQVEMTESIDKIAEEVNYGSCGLFIDGLNQGFALDVRQWGHRSIDKPENEQSIYGPQEAFAEMLRNNTALVRKIIKTEKLIAEGVKIGTVSKTRGVLLYISDIANEQLVTEVRNRINSIDIDYIVGIEEVAQLLENNSYSSISQSMSTERPDRVAHELSMGRVALQLNGSPRALIFPTSFFEMTHAPSDMYLRPPYANMTRIVRILGMLISVLFPGLYLAITLFHQELLPTYLLYAISAASANVPFPSVVELLLMDFSFEMIREAGIRMPGPVGQTLGIVGGLILGQAAVSAKIVSPIMIIVIAITGIGSFATSDYSLSWSFRIMRLIFIALGASAGFLGIAVGIFVYITYVSTIYSFGIPYLAPLPGSDNEGFFSALFVKQLWKREKRPSYLGVKRQQSEPKISRKWKNKG